MSQPGSVDLRTHTLYFMAQHWIFENVPVTPEWSPPWKFVNSIPNHNRQGCYALFAGIELIYLGVGAGARLYDYAGHGLGGRISNYIVCTKRAARGSGIGGEYKPNKKWGARGLDAIQTIGFSSDLAYLAYALEAFLISKLTPRYNSKKPGAPKK